MTLENCLIFFQEFNQQQAKLLEDLKADIELKTEMKELFNSNEEAYKVHVNNLFSKFEFELVIYDE
jgi:hypothetical protein